MGSIHPLQVVVGEALDSQAQPIDAGCPPLQKFFFVNIIGVGLEGDLGIWTNGVVLFDRVQQ